MRNLNALNFAVAAPRCVMSWRAGRRQLEAQCACGDVFRDFTGDTERLSSELIILNREGLGGGEDLANPFHCLRLAHALSRKAGPDSGFVWTRKVWPPSVPKVRRRHVRTMIC